MVPLRYNLRSILERRATPIMTAFGAGLLATMFVSVRASSGAAVPTSLVMQMAQTTRAPAPPEPELPYPDIGSRLLDWALFYNRARLLAIPHVHGVQGTVDANNNYSIVVIVDARANLPSVEQQIPSTIEGFPVQFQAYDDPPIMLDP